MTVKQLTDLQLLRLLGQRRGDALGALYDRYGPGLYRLAFAALGDSMLAEDAVHDAFMALWRRPFAAHGNVGVFLIKSVQRREHSRDKPSIRAGRLREQQA